MPEPWEVWEARFEAFLGRGTHSADPAHDPSHIRRVVASAKALARDEGADLAVVIPAAWLHDCVAVAKDSPDRPRASRLAAAEAVRFLGSVGYPDEHFEAIGHAIEAHSFSAGIPPRTLEARVVQDADRLDALGAIGIARCLMLGGHFQRPLYDPSEPIPEQRQADDSTYVLDHFYVKLFQLPGTLHTEAGRREGERRVAFMRTYVEQLSRELG